MRSKNATFILCCNPDIFALSVEWTDLRRTIRKCQFHLTLSVKKISTNLTINWKMILSNLVVIVHSYLNPDQEDPSYAIVRRTPWLEWKKASIHLCLMTSEERQLVVLSLFFRIPFLQVSADFWSILLRPSIFESNEKLLLLFGFNWFWRRRNKSERKEALMSRRSIIEFLMINFLL